MLIGCERELQSEIYRVFGFDGKTRVQVPEKFAESVKSAICEPPTAVRHEAPLNKLEELWNPSDFGGPSSINFL
jgi:hypothetical protein